MVGKAMAAAEVLANDGVEASVVNIHTVKPLDEQTVCELAERCGALVSAENHSVIGGLGDAISYALQTHNVHAAMTRVGVADTFAEGGSTPYLLNKYGLDVEHIVAAATKALALRER